MNLSDVQNPDNNLPYTIDNKGRYIVNGVPLTYEFLKILSLYNWDSIEGYSLDQIIEYLLRNRITFPDDIITAPKYENDGIIKLPYEDNYDFYFDLSVDALLDVRATINEIVRDHYIVGGHYRNMPNIVDIDLVDTVGFDKDIEGNLLLSGRIAEMFDKIYYDDIYRTRHENLLMFTHEQLSDKSHFELQHKGV